MTYKPKAHGEPVIYMGEYEDRVFGVKFRWDDRKNKINYRKHGIYFEDALNVFYDDYRAEYKDYKHSADEDRRIALGKVDDVLFVVYTERYDSQDEYDIRYIRMISARVAEPEEEEEYDEHRAFLLGQRSQADGRAEEAHTRGEAEAESVRS